MTWKLHLPTSNGSGSHLTETTHRHGWVRRNQGRKEDGIPFLLAEPLFPDGHKGLRAHSVDAERGAGPEKEKRHLMLLLQALFPAHSMCSASLPQLLVFTSTAFWETGCEKSEMLPSILQSGLLLPESGIKCPSSNQPNPRFLWYFWHRGEVLGGRLRIPFTQPLSTL